MAINIEREGVRTLTPAERQQIVDHFQGSDFVWHRRPFYLFSQIPRQKFQNACNSYAHNIQANDEVILLADKTFFGSARRGFLLTANWLFSRNHFNFISIVNLDDIEKITLDSVNIASGQSVPVMMPEIIIETDSAVARVQLWRGVNVKGFFASFKQTVEFLKSCPVEQAKPSFGDAPKITVPCSGCGAMGFSGKKCRYCRSTISNS